MDRLERLVNLVAALLDAERPLDREELRARVGGYSDDLEAFRRNFERDKDVLRQMGMPLVVEPLDGDAPDAPTGYRIPRDRYELPDPGLDDDELAAIRLAASAVQIGRQDATTGALRKLAAGVAPPGASIAQVPGDERVTVAFGAVAERRRLRFVYRSRARVLDPWRLAYRNGHWYLSGWEHDHGAERVFRLDRVEGAMTTTGEAEAFARPPASAALPPPPWRIGDETEIAAEVLFDEVVAPLALAAVGEGACIERRADGGVVLSMAVTNRSAFHSFVLGFLDHAEILRPAEARARFVESLEALREIPDRLSA